MSDTVIEVPTQDAPSFVVRIMSFVDQSERLVQERRCVSGQLPASFAAFCGSGIALIPNVDDPTKSVKQPHRFEIPGATTYEEAYGLFDAFWERELTRLKATGSVPVPKPTNFVVRVEQLSSNLEESVQEHVLVSGELPPKYPRFRGTAMFRLPNGYELPQDFVLDGAETVEEAYKLYPSICAEIDRRLGVQFMEMIKRAKEAEQKQSDKNEIAEARERAESGKKLILPKEDKRGKNGPRGIPGSGIVLPGEK